MIHGLQHFTVQDMTYGELRLVVAIPNDEHPWGVLAPLRGTPWEPFIRVVPGEAMAHARHGYAAPLVAVLGPSPAVIARRVPPRVGMCRLAQQGTCAGASPTCLPGPKLPDCYEPPGLSPVAQEMAAAVALAWRDGSYVVVVDGDEFSLA